ncbi:hypothetical protein BH10BAC2_BH10BAC2_09210 [soil metagenome]
MINRKNTKGKANLKVIFIKFIPIVFFVFVCFWGLKDGYTLISKSYLIDSGKLIQLDTIQLFNKAYRYSGSKGSSAKIEFESVKRYKFQISAERFYAVAEINKLSDTLMYNDTKFLVYTDEDGLKNYKLSNKKVIEVYQIVVDGKSYIDISIANQLLKEKLIRGIILSSVFIVIFVYFFIKAPSTSGPTSE